MKKGNSQRHRFLNHLGQTNDIPLMLEVAAADGCWITDVNGKKYLDLIAGISVSALGHNHPAVKEAIINQTNDYLHVMVYGEFVQSPQVDYATWLASKLSNPLDTVYFTNSGAEATEGATKLAKRFTRRHKMVSCVNAYHGSTQGALSLAGGEWLKSSFRPLLPNTQQIPFNDFDALDAIDEETACFVVEPIQGEAGTLLPSAGYLKAVSKRCAEQGALLIFDEIQTGFGRTGSLFAHQWAGVVPDILLLGKALGGGMPLGAFVASQQLMSSLITDPVLGHITTFGGHPVSCAAGLAMAKELDRSGWVGKVKDKEQMIKNAIKVGKVNGKGLLLSLELEGFEQVKRLVGHCYENGVITDWFLFNDRSIRMAPPLTIKSEEISFAADVINEGVRLL